LGVIVDYEKMRNLVSVIQENAVGRQDPILGKVALEDLFKLNELLMLSLGRPSVAPPE
jgi:hypothetical protein